MSKPAAPTGVYVISVAAMLVGSHPQTLRTYERLGLVSPVRRTGGSRLYSEQDITRLRRIAELSSEGISLAGIARILVLESEVVRLEAELATAAAALRAVRSPSRR